MFYWSGSKWSNTIERAEVICLQLPTVYWYYIDNNAEQILKSVRQIHTNYVLIVCKKKKIYIF